MRDTAHICRRTRRYIVHSTRPRLCREFLDRMRRCNDEGTEEMGAGLDALWAEFERPADEVLEAVAAMDPQRLDRILTRHEV